MKEFQIDNVAEVFLFNKYTGEKVLDVELLASNKENNSNKENHLEKYFSNLIPLNIEINGVKIEVFAMPEQIKKIKKLGEI